jgi:hypothetical protein
MDNREDNAARTSELSQFHRLGRDLLHQQTRAIDALIHELHSLDGDWQSQAIRVPLLMLQAVGVSIHSVLNLTADRNMSIRDCFGIARSAVETAINAAFIAVSGVTMAEKATKHMRQKRWRDLNRQGKVGSLRINVSRNVDVEIDDLPGLREALDEYTNRRGGEVRDWTPENLEARIEVISNSHQRAGLCLGVGMFAIYRPASELLHGTFYGVNLFWQGSRAVPARNRADFDELWVMEHFVTLLTTLMFAAGGAIDAIAAAHQLDGHSQRQDELAQGLAALVEEMNDGGESDEHHFRADPE